MGIRNDTNAPSKRKRRSEKYLAYQKHIRSKEFRRVREIVIERDRCCQFCGRTQEELGDKLFFNVHHLPEGYLHLNDPPEVEAQYCRLFCSACHRYAHKAPSNIRRFGLTDSNDNPPLEK